MKRQKAIPAAFNMSFGLVPVILCMILSIFIQDEYALYFCTVLGLIGSFVSFYSSGKKIYNYILYFSTTVLALLSLFASLPVRMFPQGTVPFTAEIVIILIMVIFYYGKSFFRTAFSKGKSARQKDLIDKSIDSSTVSARITFLLGVLYLLIIGISYAVSYPFSGTTRFILLQILPPVLLTLSIGINQFGIHYANKMVKSENGPVIRIAFAYNGMLFLSSHTCDCGVEKTKIDLPLESRLNYGESPQQGAENLLARAYSEKIPLEPRFSIKYSQEPEGGSILVYLYIAYIEEESLLYNPYFKQGKLWTFSQIEANLGKNFFCDRFEYEYEHLKEAVTIWEEFK